MHKKEKFEKNENIIEIGKDAQDSKLNMSKEFTLQTITESSRIDEISKSIDNIEDFKENIDGVKNSENRDVLYKLFDKVRSNSLAKVVIVGAGVALANPEIATAITQLDEINSHRELSYSEKRNIEVNVLKKKLVEHVGNSAYLVKLAREFDGNIEKALSEQKNRVKRTDSVDIDVNSDTNVWSEDLKNAGADGYYTTREHKIYIDKLLPSYQLSDRVRHELLHASTMGPIYVTGNAQKILQQSYNSPNNEGENYYSKEGKFMGIKQSYGMNDEYLNDPPERLARKQQLDLDLERLGVKKYGDDFTQEHYEKLMEEYSKGTLSIDAEMFIETTKQDPEVFKKIFNEVADNSTYEDSKIVV